MSTYTKEMLDKMRENAPLNAEKAESLASEFGVSGRSVIAKATREGIAYEKKKAPAKRGGVTKDDRVKAIAAALGASEKEADTLHSLGKASVAALSVLASKVDAETDAE